MSSLAQILSKSAKPSAVDGAPDLTTANYLGLSGRAGLLVFTAAAPRPLGLSVLSNKQGRPPSTGRRCALPVQQVSQCVPSAGSGNYRRPRMIEREENTPDPVRYLLDTHMTH